MASLDVVRTLLSKYRRLNQGEWPGYCPTHRRNVAALTALLTKQSVKRPSGRPVGTTTIDVGQTLADIKSVVLSLKAAGEIPTKVTANRVARLLNIGSPETGGNTMMERVKKGGITQDWRELRDLIWEGRLNTLDSNLIPRIKFESVKLNLSN
jgi:GH24 family phage-related lysozyme (muramidase)